MRMIGKGPTALQDLLAHIGKWDRILEGTLVDLVIQRVIPGDELGIEEVVFEGSGAIPMLVEKAWKSLGHMTSQSGNERRERGPGTGARGERQALAASAEDSAALAALAPSSD